MESDRVAGVGRSDVAWRGSGSGRYHRVTLRCGGGSGKHHRGCPSGGLRDRKDPSETSTFNGQIPYGTDILTRIFHCQEDRGTLEILRKAAVTSITTCVRELEAQQQLPETAVVAMAIGGNTTMIHFLSWDGCVLCLPHSVLRCTQTSPDFSRQKIWNCR